jgi:arylsulfatase A-like enzyme
MDWAAGEVLTALDSLGLAQDGKTVVFFTSDHGPHIELCLEGGRTGGLRGGKSYSSWEGGVRVPGAGTVVKIEIEYGRTDQHDIGILPTLHWNAPHARTHTVELGKS